MAVKQGIKNSNHFYYWKKHTNMFGWSQGFKKCMVCPMSDVLLSSYRAKCKKVIDLCVWGRNLNLVRFLRAIPQITRLVTGISKIIFFFWIHHLGRGQRSKFKFTLGSIGCKKSRMAKTGTSQKQYHFWNPCNQTSNLRYYMPTLGPSSNFEIERKGQRPFNILPYNSVTKHPI